MMKTENLLMAGLAVAVFYAAYRYSQAKKSPYIQVTQYGRVYDPQPSDKPQTVWL